MFRSPSGEVIRLAGQDKQRIPYMTARFHNLEELSDSMEYFSSRRFESPEDEARNDAEAGEG